MTRRVREHRGGSDDDQNASTQESSYQLQRADARSPTRARRCCGLCGKTARLTQTKCCQQWICNDEDKYVMFSFAHNSCHRNHDRYTLCAHHHNEQHEGTWQECQKCRASFETEMYVYHGTNKYNFEKLATPPSYEPTRCKTCGEVIRLGYDGYSMSAEGYFCESCQMQELGPLLGQKS